MSNQNEKLAAQEFFKTSFTYPPTVEQIGLKHDEGKQSWYALPLEVLEPLADLFEAGASKYELFNCLKPFDSPNQRFYNGMMRHVKLSQMDALAKDEETKCYHLAAVAFNALMRLYHMRKEERC